MPTPSSQRTRATAAANRTPQQKLADHLLGRSVDDFLAEGRACGKSYRALSRELFLATDGQVDVSDFSLRLWHRRAVGSGQEAEGAPRVASV